MKQNNHKVKLSIMKNRLVNIIDFLGAIPLTVRYYGSTDIFRTKQMKRGIVQ